MFPLPPILQKRGHSSSYMKAENRVNSAMKHLAKACSQKPLPKVQPVERNRPERTRNFYARLDVLRKNQPLLEGSETMNYRYDPYHKLCINMLQDGFHRAFSELHGLVERQKREKIAAGPDWPIWYKPPLNEELDYLKVLNCYLVEAEEATREFRFSDVYHARLMLAEYFLAAQEKWLSDHFYESCLTTCVENPIETIHLAEAYCNMGKVMESSGDVNAAADHFEAYYELVSDEKLKWKNEEGNSLKSVAAAHLTRIYSALAEKETHTETKMELYEDACEFGKESGIKELEALVSYKRGLEHEKRDEFGLALHYLKKYFDQSRLCHDDRGVGLACEAIGRCYHQIGEIEECMKYLRSFVTNAQKAENDEDLSRAFNALGITESLIGLHRKAHDSFTKSYEIVKKIDNSKAQNRSKVNFGIGVAHHKMLANLSRSVEMQNESGFDRLFKWKKTRCGMGPQLEIENGE